MNGPQSELQQQVNDLQQQVKELERQLEACHGTAVGDVLDGKPLPGNWQDGTDGACLGWWRGQEQGAHAALRIQVKYEALLKLNKEEHA